MINTKTRALALKIQDGIDAVYIPYATSNGRVDSTVMLKRLSELNQTVSELVAETGSAADEFQAGFARGVCEGAGPGATQTID